MSHRHRLYDQLLDMMIRRRSGSLRAHYLLMTDPPALYVDRLYRERLVGLDRIQRTNPSYDPLESGRVRAGWVGMTASLALANVGSPEYGDGEG